MNLLSARPTGHVLILTDNPTFLTELSKLLSAYSGDTHIDLACSPSYSANNQVPFSVQILDLKTSADDIVRMYRLAISIHCKQLFPRAIYSTIPCVNVHPGYNPETRGWFPQVWAILHGKKLGFTIHLMDDKIDHGDIIDRKEVQLHNWDTSESAYKRVIDAEIEWLRLNFNYLLSGHYDIKKMEHDGLLYQKKDFDALCNLDLREVGEFGYFINKLRALSFNGHNNAYFIDESTGKKIYVHLEVKCPE